MTCSCDNSNQDLNGGRAYTVLRVVRSRCRHPETDWLRSENTRLEKNAVVPNRGLCRARRQPVRRGDQGGGRPVERQLVDVERGGALARRLRQRSAAALRA